jgi:hypothetical protein
LEVEKLEAIKANHEVLELGEHVQVLNSEEEKVLNVTMLNDHEKYEVIKVKNEVLELDELVQGVNSEEEKVLEEIHNAQSIQVQDNL